PAIVCQSDPFARLSKVVLSEAKIERGKHRIEVKGEKAQYPDGDEAKPCNEIAPCLLAPATTTRTTSGNALGSHCGSPTKGVVRSMQGQATLRTRPAPLVPSNLLGRFYHGTGKRLEV